MATEYMITESSRLPAPAAEVWARALTPEGVNRELRPLARMTCPADFATLADSIRLGERLFRSWILLGGVLPVDYDDLTIVELEPGRRFLERSTMLTQRLWEHERVVEPDGDGCRVTDRVRFVPRIPLLGPLYRPIFAATFRLRHRNLRAMYASRSS